MNCNACGYTVPEGAVFCPKCGARIGSQPQAPPPLPQYPPSSYPPPYPPSSGATGGMFRRPAVITILAVLNLVFGAFLLVGGASILIFAPKSKSDDLLFALIAGGLLLLLAALHLIAGHGLWAMKSYARTIQIVFAVPGLLLFPIGTIVCALILVYLFKPEVKLLFSGRTEADLSPQESAMLAAFAGSGASGAAIAIAIVAVLIGGVFILGIVSAIAIPNLLNAIQRGKQKRTMADIRAIGTACEAYAVDNNVYPDVESLDSLAKVLEPTYIRQMPRTDGWEHSYHYDSWRYEDESDEGPAHYLIASSGKDGLLEHEDLEGYEELATQSFNNDIVFSDGEFLEYPDTSTGH